MVARLVFQVVRREKIAGGFLSFKLFSILLWFTGENFQTDAQALYLSTDRTWPSCTSACFLKEGEREALLMVLVLLRGCQLVLTVVISGV